MAELKQSFREFIFATNTDGSGKAASYVRALDMLGPTLTRYYPKPIIGGSMWHSFSLADIHAVLTRVPWGHHMLISDTCHSQPEKALFYVRRTIQNGWSRGVLRNWLSTDLYEREGKAQTNFAHRVRISSSTCMRFRDRRITRGFSRSGTRPSSRQRRRPNDKLAVKLHGKW